MAKSTAPSDISLQLSKTYRAPADRLFRAWTDPEIIKQWWPPEGFSEPSAEVDLTIGGAFRIGMKPPQGDVFYATGTYQEIDSPKKLVFTWRWEAEDLSGMDPGETLVTVEFHAKGDETQVILTHSNVASHEERGKLEQGWKGCLERIGEAA